MYQSHLRFLRVKTCLALAVVTIASCSVVEPEEFLGGITLVNSTGSPLFYRASTQEVASRTFPSDNIILPLGHELRTRILDSGSAVTLTDHDISGEYHPEDGVVFDIYEVSDTVGLFRGGGVLTFEQLRQRKFTIIVERSPSGTDWTW